MIELHHIHKQYPNRDSVLTDVSLKVASGSCTAILGRSGCGKTTLMNLLGLLDVPDSGSYLLDGQDVSCLSAKQRSLLRRSTFGFVFQHFFLLPRMNVFHNVALPLVYQGVSVVEQKRMVDELLVKVGMQDYLLAKPNQLSGGQQQRIALARALVGRPRVLLADEPTGALDSATGDMIMNLLLQLQQESKTTVILVTHDQHVAGYSQQKIVMQDGCIQVMEQHA
jgi:putative ABC transport system ATP-binding protein